MKPANFMTKRIPATENHTNNINVEIVIWYLSLFCKGSMVILPIFCKKGKKSSEKKYVLNESNRNRREDNFAQ